MVGPVGLEPTTKGFTLPAVSGGSGLSLHPPSRLGWGAGRSRLSLRALKLSGSLCTVRRCTAGLAQGCHGQRPEGFPEFIPSTPRITPRRHFFRNESPALTAVLQAQGVDCTGQTSAAVIATAAVAPRAAVLLAVGHQPFGAHAIELAPLRLDIGTNRAQRRLEARVLTQRTVRRIRLEVIPPVEQL